MSHSIPVAGTTHNGRYLDDGSIELLIVVPPNQVTQHSSRLMEHGCNIGLVELAYRPANWGKESQQLRLSQFFYTPDVWEAIGSDEKYQAWCRRQKSAHSGRLGIDGNPIVYAHVRRVAAGSGMAKKPIYSGIPLLNTEHQQQHQGGETSLLDSNGKRRTREWYNKTAIDHVVRWAWETLKHQLGYEHWPQVPPEKLRGWAESKGVDRHLPKCYRG